METIEEVAKRIYPINIVSDGYDTNMLCRTGFYIGYEFGKERSYSEEEVKEILKLRLNWFRISSNEFEDNKWFEQFKKK